MSSDPAMESYIPEASSNEGADERNQNLPGMGGIYNSRNLQTYHYAGNNPLKYTDPTGMYDTDYWMSPEGMKVTEEAEAFRSSPEGKAILREAKDKFRNDIRAMRSWLGNESQKLGDAAVMLAITGFITTAGAGAYAAAEGDPVGFVVLILVGVLTELLAGLVGLASLAVGGADIMLRALGRIMDGDDELAVLKDTKWELEQKLAKEQNRKKPRENVIKAYENAISTINDEIQVIEQQRREEENSEPKE